MNHILKDKGTAWWPYILHLHLVSVLVQILIKDDNEYWLLDTQIPKSKHFNVADNDVLNPIPSTSRIIAFSFGRLKNGHQSVSVSHQETKTFSWPLESALWFPLSSRTWWKWFCVPPKKKPQGTLELPALTLSNIASQWRRKNEPIRNVAQPRPRGSCQNEIIYDQPAPIQPPEWLQL